MLLLLTAVVVVDCCAGRGLMLLTAILGAKCVSPTARTCVEVVCCSSRELLARPGEEAVCCNCYDDAGEDT